MNQAGTVEPCYALRLAQAFLPLVPRTDAAVAAVVDELKDRDPDERILIAQAHVLLQAAVSLSGDPSLGLKAGRAMFLGDAGVVDYAMQSPGTVQNAIENAGRYIRLLNDALVIRTELESGRAIVRLQSHVAQPRAAEDFMLSGLFTIHVRRLPLEPSEVECWLTYPAPADLSEHRRTFGEARLRFCAPYSAFVFAASALQAPIVGADPRLHAVVRKHAERALAELPRGHTFTETVRRLVSERLAQGHLTAATIAGQLHMSQRTLSRRLAHEGTSFGALLEELRRSLALSYLSQGRLGIAEVAFLVGFSRPEAFHRAFRRWTGQTPLEYRRASRG